ncbi:putative glucan endo-1,3-beta-glucosidase btgC [Colletotrichum spaethianum]|uniref:Glucan endo-1,3-beta-glucosidase btgC n=1 Tax=Colletotrichum spaethianum TaxID=700344 RepID=A0AA37LEP1_9PEZI|nr:putative glucan endo-1,3-beta-glucosidase btgC [Colletotrichum spaethianum]GKT46029.1 putative glucan endo-1,3-beta-glucosidase btgC [Colletotrichum spaethianum]
MLLHLKPDSDAYLENVWAWVADHDLDQSNRNQIDIYVARGMLIESKKAWLWGTSSEHCVFYQYQISGASNIAMGMIQTESPYYQPVPKAPQPFRTGLFPNDPTFNECSASDAGCYSAWALRIIDSSAVYILGAGLYSWFSDYSQECLNTNDCQKRAVEIQQSSDLWVYNLCTKAIVEMVTPIGGVATLAKDNINGFLSSILAWLEGSKDVTGQRDFEGFQLFTLNGLRNQNVPETCKTALSAKVLCDFWVSMFEEPGYRGTLGNKTLTDSVCDSGCGKSLQSWFDNVNAGCQGYNISGEIPTLHGGRIWAGYNETCLKDPETGLYCNDLIADFSSVGSIQEMPQSEMCSECYINRLALMQSSPYSIYDDNYKSDLELVYKTCGETGPTDIPPPVSPGSEEGPTLCLSEKWHTISQGASSCKQVASINNVSSVALYSMNPQIFDCNSIPDNTELCLPLSCGRIISYTDQDTCSGLEAAHDLEPGDVQRFNPWVYRDCSNLSDAIGFFGNLLCAAPQNGEYVHGGPGSGGDTVTPHPGGTGYTSFPIDPPNNATIAEGTTTKCGRWHVSAEGDSCATICLSSDINIALFIAANPSLGSEYSECTSSLVLGNAYCSGPTYDWEDTEEL